MLASRGWPLFVPIHTSPFATIGDETGAENWPHPTSARHLMFFPVLSFQSRGGFFSGLTGLREWSRPNIGQSSAKRARGGPIKVAAHASAAKRERTIEFTALLRRPPSAEAVWCGPPGSHINTHP